LVEADMAESCRGRRTREGRRRRDRQEEVSARRSMRMQQDETHKDRWRKEREGEGKRSRGERAPPAKCGVAFASSPRLPPRFLLPRSETLEQDRQIGYRCGERGESDSREIRRRSQRKRKEKEEVALR
jgi:hypothetical protein